MTLMGFPGGASGKESASVQDTQETQARFLGGKDPLEEGMAAHSSILAWGIPWTEEPGGLPSIGPHRVTHDSSDLAHSTCSGSLADSSFCRCQA